jgi:DNA repair exonuclease SbcCD ATPase subunit
MTAFSLGGLSMENMGIEYINEKTLVNYLIYACFIFVMPIMFLNIFQSISIDEMKNLYDESEANEIKNKVEYIFLVEETKESFLFRKFSGLISKIEKRLREFYRFLSSFKWISGIIMYDETKQTENLAENSKENGFDKKFLIGLRAKMNELNSKNDSSYKKVERNFEEIKKKIERLEKLNELNSKNDWSDKKIDENFEEMKSKIGRVDNMIVDIKENIEKYFVNKNHKSSDDNNIDSESNGKEDKINISQLKNKTESLERVIVEKIGNIERAFGDKQSQEKLIDSKFEKLEKKIKKIDNKLEKVEQIEKNIENLLSELGRKVEVPHKIRPTKSYNTDSESDSESEFLKSELADKKESKVEKIEKNMKQIERDMEKMEKIENKMERIEKILLEEMEKNKDATPTKKEHRKNQQ